MKLNIKEYFKLSLIYIVIGAFPSLLQTFTQPFIVGKGKLNAVDFSHIAITEIVTSFVFVVALWAMGNAISRFYYDFINDKKGYNKLVSSVMNSIIFRGIIFLLVAIISGNFIGQYFSQKELQYFPSWGYASIILGISRALSYTAFALYRNEKKVTLFIVFNVALGILRTGFQIIGLFYYKMSFIGYLYGGCVGSIITTFFIIAYIYYKSGIHYDFKILKPLNDFGRPLFIYSLISWGLMYAGRIFLENYPKELGIYFTAINFALGIQLVIQGIQGATQPEVYKFFSLGIKEHQEEIRRLSNLQMLQAQALIAIAIIPTMLYLTLFYKSDVRMASTFICIIFVDYILKSQIFIFSLPIYYLKKTKFLFFINTVALVINLLLNYFLTPYLKANGLIAATIVSDLILALGIYYYQKKIIFIDWNIKKVIVFPLVITFIAAVVEVFKNVLHVNQYLSSVLVVCVIISGMSLLYRNEIRGLVLKYIKI